MTFQLTISDPTESGWCYKARAHRELAEIVVYSIKCMGKVNALYVSKQLINKIAQARGAVRLMQ